MGESNYKHGEMDVSVQNATFDGFVKWSTRIAVFAIAIVVFLAVFAS